MRVLLSVVAVLFLSSANAVEQESTANPIRRVVQMLQRMEKKVTEEGAKQKEMFEKYMCYCETNEAALAKTVADAEEKIPQVLAEIKELTQQKAQLQAELVQHKADRSDAQASIGSATAQREKEAGEFAKESGDLKSNIDALARAIPAIEKGMAGQFLQTAAGQRLAKLLRNNDLSLGRFETQNVEAFLQGGAEYTPGSGEIVGILKQMKESMEKDLKELTAAENSSIAVFEELVAAKEKEIAAATKAIEQKTARAGETAVALANAKHDHEDTVQQYEDDKKFLGELKKGCATQEGNWELISKTRQQELVAIAETVRILNSDDALELFKKTLPGQAQSLLQVQTTSKQVVSKALQLLHSVRHGGPALDFIALALRGKKVGFEKVVKMVDNMVVTLKREQEDDDAQKEWCGAETDKTEDSVKDLGREKSNLETSISESEDTLKTLAAEIEALEDGITTLDKQVADATAQRKEEHESFVSELADNNAALQILDFARNRMNKFYNPKMYRAPQTPVPTEEQRQYFAATGEVPPELTPAPVVIPEAFVEIREHSQVVDAPAPPPAALPAYKRAGQSSNGVLGMLDSIIHEVKMEVQEGEGEEKEAQKDYEELMADSAKKRADDSKSISDKESAKAEMEEQLAGAKDSHKATAKELMNTGKYLSEVHSQCDWLVENYGLRKSARADEIDALQKAKAVLSGADYSLLQKDSFLAKRA